MFSFIKNSFQGTLSVGIRLASSFFLNKIVAIYFGPAGLAQLAHLQNLLTFFTIIPNDGINRALIKYLAGKPSDSTEFFRYLKIGFYFTLLVYLFVALVIILGRNYFLAYLPWNVPWLVGFLIAAFLIVLQAFFNAVLLARQKHFLLVIGNVIAAIGVILYLVAAKSVVPLPVFLIGYLLTLGAMVIYTLPVSLRGIALPLLMRTPVLANSAKQIGTFILMSVSVLLFSKGLEYYIRSYLFEHYSVYDTGLWQGVVRISDSYTAIYTAVLAFAFYPKVAALMPDKAALKVFVRGALIIVIPVTFLGLAGVYILRDQIFTLLLSHRFLAAQSFIPYQLSGDFFKLLSWLLANILVAQANFRVIFIIEAISAAAYLGFFYYFTRQFGITGTSMAHCANYLTFLILNIIYFRKLLFT